MRKGTKERNKKEKVYEPRNAPFRAGSNLDDVVSFIFYGMSVTAPVLFFRAQSLCLEGPGVVH